MGLDETLIAVVERKAMDEFCNSLVDGTLGLAMGELAQLGTTAVVVERTYTATVTRRLCRWRLGLGYLLVRLQVRVC